MNYSTPISSLYSGKTHNQKIIIRPNAIIISGFKKRFVLFRMWMSVSFFILNKYPSPFKFYKIIKRVRQLRNKNTVGLYAKLALVDGKIFLNCAVPGWPSKQFNHMIELEARMALEDEMGNMENLRLVLIALTKKCPLQCEHCYEGPELNKRETMGLLEHKRVLDKLQANGIPMIHYGGGDPLAKINDLIDLLNYADKNSDFWIYTSGFNLTAENASQLKDAGLTGVAISIDHFNPELHNKFRGNKNSFQWAIDAAWNARNVNLVTSLSICTTKEFTSKENLYQYLELAKNIGVSFIQLLEPRAAGNYAGKDIFLSNSQEIILETFFLHVNNDPQFKNYPIILYPAYHQRRTGCPGAGSKYLYIDTDGYMSNCPFCRNRKTHVLGEDHEKNILEMKNEGCGKYELLN